eukprot:COSAG06_NODE_4011_length_4663_cov_7.007230_3_plen_439_part_00
MAACQQALAAGRALPLPLLPAMQPPADEADQNAERVRRKTFAADERRSNPTRPLLSLSADDVLAWSSSLGLPSEISTAFAAKGTDGPGLARLTKDQLREGLLADGARMKLGHVHKLLQAILALAAEGWSPVAALEETDESAAGGGPDEDQHSALLAEIAGADDETAGSDAEFGQHLSHWANDAGAGAVVAAPAASEIAAPAVVEEGAAGAGSPAPAMAEAGAARSARLSKLAPPEPEPEPEPEPVLEPEPAKSRPKAKPAASKTKFSLDYSRFELDSDSDEEDSPSGSRSAQPTAASTPAASSMTWAEAEAALLKARPVQPLSELHVALGAVPPPIAAQTIVDSLKTRGLCVCDAGADVTMLQAALREALGCMQAGLLHPPGAGTAMTATESAVVEGASGASVMRTSAPNAAEAAKRNPILLELEAKVEALGMGAIIH